MKKFISVIVISSMLISAPIYASDINVSEMKTEELLALKVQLKPNSQIEAKTAND